MAEARLALRPESSPVARGSLELSEGRVVLARGDATGAVVWTRRALDSFASASRIHLENGRTISTPLEGFPRLRDASATERGDWRLIGRGVGIHWEALDEDLSVRGLLEGAAAVQGRRAS